MAAASQSETPDTLTGLRTRHDKVLALVAAERAVRNKSDYASIRRHARFWKRVRRPKESEHQEQNGMESCAQRRMRELLSGLKFGAGSRGERPDRTLS